MIVPPPRRSYGDQVPDHPPWTRPGPPRIPHQLLLVAVAGVQVAGTFGAGRDQPDAKDVDALAIALLLAGPLLLGILWKRPVVALWAAVACTLAYIGGGYPYGPFVLTPLIALVHTVVAGHRRAAWIAGAVGGVGALVAHDLSPRPERSGGASLSALIGVTTWVVIVLVGSEILRTNRERRREAAIAAAEQDRRRASEERLRIAQELHDVLAHDISLINVQAGVGLHLMETRPDQAREALSTIKQASKEALVELRAALDLLRNGDAAPRTPTGGLDHLDGLVARMRTPQLDVTLERSGDERPVPPGVDLAAFRIVQEALTNVVRHALAVTRVDVRVEYRSDSLVVQVDDDGRTAPGRASDTGTSTGSGTGSGIAGMRARAHALGGELDAGTRADGGFRVRAWLPLPDESDTDPPVASREPSTVDVAGPESP
jgi:signal transduction histidine kinase